MKNIGKDQIEIIEGLFKALSAAPDVQEQKALIERFLYEANFPPTEHNFNVVARALQKKEPVSQWLQSVDHFPGMKIMGDENSFRFFLQDFFVARGQVYAHDVLAFLGCPRDAEAEHLVEQWAHRELGYADFLEKLDQRIHSGVITPPTDRRQIFPLRGIHVFQCIEEGYPNVDVRLENGGVRKFTAMFTTEEVETLPSEFLPLIVESEALEQDGIPVAFTAAVVQGAKTNPILMGRQFVFHFTSEERLVFDESGEFQYVNASQVA